MILNKKVSNYKVSNLNKIYNLDIKLSSYNLKILWIYFCNPLFVETVHPYANHPLRLNF